jgi:RNase P/RNase MRP subunit p29
MAAVENAQQLTGETVRQARGAGRSAVGIEGWIVANPCLSVIFASSAGFAVAKLILLALGAVGRRSPARL